MRKLRLRPERPVVHAWLNAICDGNLGHPGAVCEPRCPAIQPGFRLGGAAQQVFSALMSALMKAIIESADFYRDIYS